MNAMPRYRTPRRSAGDFTCRLTCGELCAYLMPPFWRRIFLAQSFSTLAIRSKSLEWYVFDRFKILDAAQHDAVRAFLEYVREYPGARTSYREEADRALARYWGFDERIRPTGPKII